MQEAIALKTIEIMNPALVKVIVMITTLVAMYRFLNRENYEWSQSEDDYNWKWAYIGASVILLIPNILIESIDVLNIRLSESYLISAYDVYYGFMPQDPKSWPETRYLFVDSGGYEINDSYTS